MAHLCCNAVYRLRSGYLCVVRLLVRPSITIPSRSQTPTESSSQHTRYQPHSQSSHHSYANFPSRKTILFSSRPKCIVLKQQHQRISEGRWRTDQILVAVLKRCCHLPPFRARVLIILALVWLSRLNSRQSGHAVCSVQLRTPLHFIDGHLIRYRVPKQLRTLTYSPLGVAGGSKSSPASAQRKRAALTGREPAAEGRTKNPLEVAPLGDDPFHVARG